MDHTDEVPLSFGDLNIGQLYPIKEATKENRNFNGKLVESVKLDISDSPLLKTVTYVPSGILKFAQDNIDAINQASASGKCYNACFYGLIDGPNRSKRFIGRIHKPDEVVSQDELLKLVEKTNAMVNKKRVSSNLSGDAGCSSSPTKIIKLEPSAAASSVSPEKEVPASPAVSIVNESNVVSSGSLNSKSD
ncbi:hypothetical protein FOCC_FOCC013235 [Frankliniella occidentalis]|uniref:Uncharacterized protein LOC113215438 n=1 Tax=Frankliniella occidentalis TaxID=133901 RepID=A0A6J1TJ52_FRAOC|nr:uncharacterized protein LOC113215438 [Frankliniella occidentalis]KAE8741248.1 hypothetical protein FOCC_FOCC013235 [Frankliniella occidentalis]